MPRKLWEPHEDELLHRLVANGVPWCDIGPQFPGRSLDSLKSRIHNERYLDQPKSPETLFAMAMGDARYTDNPEEAFKSRTRQPKEVGAFFTARTLGGVAEYGAANG